MKTTLLFSILFLCLFTTYAQSPSRLLKKCPSDIITADTSHFKLVMTSASGCGYCLIAMRELQEINKNPKLNIFVIDFGDKNQRDKHHSQFYNIYNFVEIDDCKKKNKPKFFPMFVLYDSENKVVWKKKGWNKNNLIAIKKELQND